jgi:LPXTG-site transpeptidase (sortase) family protein
MSGGPAARRYWLAGVALLIVGGAAVAIGVHSRETSSNAAVPPFVASSVAPTPTPTPSLAAVPKTAKPVPSVAPSVAPALARSVPVKLVIPAIKVSVSLSQLGLNPDGTVEVPTDFAQPGWFHLGPSPGQLGSSVILGHVHSHRGPSIFWNLGKLHIGDSIAVRLADGVVAHFAVTKVAAYPKQDFPSHLVYGSHGLSELQLVTCGGVYDKKNHRYLSNVVVYSVRV